MSCLLFSHHATGTVEHLSVEETLPNCVISNGFWISLKSIGSFSIQTPGRLQALQNALGLIGCDSTCQSQ